MPDNQVNHLARGKTYFQGQTPATGQTEAVHLEGAVRIFPAEDSTSSINGLIHGGDVKAILVRNDSGIALLPSRLATWKSGYRGRKVDGYCTTTAQEVAGVVDDHLPTAGVPDDDLFWLIVEGPCLVKTPLAGDATNVISEGSLVYALTAATSQATTSGRFQGWNGTFTATQTTDGTAGLILANAFGRAMSAKTTANSNATCLIDLKIG